MALLFRLRYVSFFVCSRCLDAICICGPGDWTFFGTPLFLSYWDLLSVPRSDRICAEDLGAAVGPPWLGTEEPDHQQTVDIWLQILVGWGRVLQTVLVPTAISWYICRGWGLSCIPVSPPGPVERNVFFGNFNHTLVCVHGFYNIVCFSPNTTIHQCF